MARPLSICFIANAHSVHVRTLLKYFAGREHTVYIVSPFKCLFEVPGARLVNVQSDAPLDAARRRLRNISAIRRALVLSQRASAGLRRALLPDERLLARIARQVEAADRAERASWESVIDATVDVANKFLASTPVDIVQACRVYPEGLITAGIQHPRKVLFAWGSDLSGYATWYADVGERTRRALGDAAGLVTDNCKDYDFATRFGYPVGRPHLLIPSNGGIDTSVEPGIRWPRGAGGAREFATIRRIGNAFMDNAPVIEALAHLARRSVPARYTMHALPFGPHYDRYRILARRLGVWDRLRFAPPYPPHRVFDVLAGCRLQVSPALDDGSSNAMLETMWAGAVPIYSNATSIREWIADGENGYLFDIGKPAAIAEVLERAASDGPDVHDKMAVVNQRLVSERADYLTCMDRLVQFYRSL